jgi:formate--tetrahydrofolate ligase
LHALQADADVRKRFARLQADGFGHLPMCVAKPHYSFSTDAIRRGAPTGHSLPMRELRLSAGVEFVVAVCGDIVTMPRLPRVPAANRIGLTEACDIVGLF